jgi:hypothetical protein
MANISPDVPSPPCPRPAARDDAPAPAASGALDMEEYMHYALAANGGVRVVVPGRLLFLPPPRTLPAGRAWLDGGGGGGRRAFSAGFYAELLADDFGLGLLVRAGRPDAYDPAPFLARGAAVEDLPLGRGGAGGLLRRVDRFLTLAAAAPGAVAVHGGEEEGEEGAEGPLVPVLAAALLRLHGFPAAAAAVAWLRMACPCAGGGGGEVLRDLEELAAAAAAARRRASDAGGPEKGAAAAAAAGWLLRRALSAPEAEAAAAAAGGAGPAGGRRVNVAGGGGGGGDIGGGGGEGGVDSAPGEGRGDSGELEGCGLAAAGESESLGPPGPGPGPGSELVVAEAEAEAEAGRPCGSLTVERERE